MNDEIKVLHIFSKMNRGGAETLIMNVMRNLTGEGIKFFFLVTSPLPGHFDNEIIRLGGEIIYIKTPSMDRQFTSDFKKVLKALQPDVVHSHVYTFSGHILNVSRQCNIPIRIAHSHTINDNKKNTISRHLYFSFMKRLINRKATHLLGCSIEACDKLFGDKSRQDSRVKIIKNGIDLNQFKPFGAEKNDLRSFLGISPESIVVGHVGSFRYPKNHEKVINVFKEFSVKNSDAHLVLIGDGPLRNKVEDLIEKNSIQDNVHFLGVRDDVPQLMQQFDLFLFPSKYEGLGLVLIEAQAAGTFCITSDQVPKEADLGMGMVEFLTLDKNNNYWVAKMCSSLELTKVPWIYREDCVKSNGYDIESTVQELEEIYEEALVNKKW